MPIKKAKELDFSEKKIVMLLSGRPGIGKTTLALSSPRPLLIDLEDGVDRVEACHRKDTMTNEYNGAERYEQFIKDLKEEDLSDYDTVIIDTLGKLFDMITPVVIKENSVNGLKDGRTLSLKGYGAVGQKISDFIKMIKDKGKNVVIISHVTEKNDGEITKIRLQIPGATKDNIWNDIDLGGYIEYVGKDRKIFFTPSERFDAKGTHGITGSYDVPVLKTTENGGKEEDNVFLSKLFKIIINNLTKTKNAYEDEKEKYMVVMNDFLPKVKNCENLETLNELLVELQNIEHASSSKKELWQHIQDKAKELGVIYDKEEKRFVSSIEE